MFTVALLYTAPTRCLLLCRFPYALLTPFKEAVHYKHRTFRPELRAWSLTPTGFLDLCHAEAERLNPLPLDVLDWAFPALPSEPPATHGRATRRRAHVMAG